MKKEMFLTCPLFQAVSPAALEHLLRSHTVMTFKRNRKIFASGEVANGLFLVIEGRVKLYAEIDGREQIRSIVSEGEVFGEGCLIGMDNRCEMAVALDKKVVAAYFPLVTLLDWTRQFPEVQAQMLRYFGDQLFRAQQRLEALVFLDSRSRILHYLRETAQKKGVSVGYEVLIRQFPTHREVASLTDTSRQTVTLVFGELRRSNAIHIDRNNLLIRDMARFE
jgi:CRP/FNR family cyclic AMP-dependent transcriptional regulator